MKLVTTALAFSLASFSLAAPVAAQQITGAGATFPAPVYAKWGEAAKAAIGIELNYQAIGSGGGHPEPHGRFRRLRRADGPGEAGFG